VYEIIARNAGYGIWVAEEKGFIISRFKWSDNFLFVEHHWDTGPPHGTAKPWKDLGRAPFDYIPLLEVAKGTSSPEIEEKLLQYLNHHQRGDDAADNSL